MLRGTYIHIPKVGTATEKSLWEQGALDWQTFLDEPDKWHVPDDARRMLLFGVEQSAQAYEAGDYRFFAGCLPSSERWRAFQEFKEKCAYVDIETDGTSQYITVVGVYDGTEVYQFVAEQNLEEFPEFIRQYAMIVTFNGIAFDLPMLQKRFPSLFFDQVHVDLCPTLRRLGLRGGLKRIEHTLGFQRDPDVEGLDGWAAVRLWNAYRRGSEQALDTLLRYNKEDIINLKPLMELAYRKLRFRTGYTSSI